MIKRGDKVKWASRYKDGHWFHGKVLRVIEPAADDPKGDRIAIVDDNTGLAYRCIPTGHLFEEIRQ